MQSGLAKARFSESYNRSPWLEVGKEKRPVWPTMDSLLAKQRLTYLDYVLTHRLLRDQLVGQEVALFICHLLIAAQEGHLCVRIENGHLFPAVYQLWSQEGDDHLSSEESQFLTDLILKGSKEVPLELMTVMQEGEDHEPPQTPLCVFQNSFYLQRHWIFETLFLKHLLRHLDGMPVLEVSREYLEKELTHLRKSGALLEEQAEAILTGCLSPLTLITGGPGTGKTYTAGRLIQLFWNSLNEEQRKECQIALAAPTGKAAANLQKSLSKVANELKDCPPLQAKTLHSLLNMRSSSSFAKESAIRLTADLIVVDESSMIDVKMMATLFESLKKGSRIILLGDQHQLPSVEAGSLFVDLIKLHQAQPALAIPCTNLKVCLRAELGSIVSFAQTINQGKALQAIDLLNQADIPGISRLHLPAERKESQKLFLSHVMNYFPSLIRSHQDPEQLLNLFNAIRILSPMRKGSFGVESINQLLWQHVSQMRHPNGWLAIPIMVVTNDYRQDLFNGETGVLMRKLPLKTVSTEDYALFPSRNAGETVRRLPALLLPRYEFAYCLSVHKSQGSEFDRVILVLPEGSELFGREVFYTAVTRARKHIEVYGTDLIIQKTISLQGSRLSGVEQRLATAKI
ncbi:exodeoxyribonuclease V alpha chain [Candidatus Protochlamydia naegleriophila]|uniref:RecBCD enzyme subunit RecD n=1 Tax=Candidatus Protochlamydia naegleriophila TaxID=389348 RepID=A0A0U5CSI6_9BACT|nr:exodeoxyribonuclease V subunit alpha [Candidatus Protochlamydia naegleriophila]CUI17996.1 exodeoxyribonuclease V alpha chain [Candidatus Protochlamydia naegleriophila]